MSLDLTTALKDFTGKPLLEATRDLFKKTLSIPLSPLADSPIEAKRFFGAHFKEKRHADVKAVYLAGRITDDSFGLFENEVADMDALEAELKDAQDYPGLFIFAVDLGDAQLTRSELSNLTRDVNRLFPTPVIVVFKHTLSSQLVLSFGVAERRQHKKDKSRHVMGKVSMIRDIDPNKPHRGHLDLLARFSLKELKTPSGQKVDNFKTFHQAIAEIFNVELLNKQFYRELSNWYFWAMQNCHFPYLDSDTDKYDLFKDEDKVREHDAKNLIRLLTRILFVWFIKEKGLVPDSFFETNSLKKELLKEFNPNSKETNYYKAILQNLFFATLNQTHSKREFRKPGQHQNTTTLLRYEDRLKRPKQFVEIVEATTPFLNGGLFDCLDYPHPTKKGPQGGAVIVFEDGFSDRKNNTLNVPDFLFFGLSKEVDLSDDYGDNQRNQEKVRGLIHILNGYKFTIVENTPVEQEIALDPELLGQVFENLLASYNPETKTTARKQTGSFYTPRPIVDYMVDESLKAHLLKALTAEAGMDQDEAKKKLEDLFTYNEEHNPFNKEQTKQLIRAIDNCKILDPACGSGAFPMGVLHKLVYVLGKLDPRDELWEKRQLAKVDKLIEAAQDFEDASFRERAIEDAKTQRRDIEETFNRNELGYGRKLYLIENCLYGVDIQPIAAQISKLRFFISLIADQTVDPSRENFGIRPLPNLETKFVTADSLIQIEKQKSQSQLFEIAEVSELQRELKQVRHDLFSAKTPKTKNKHRIRDKELRDAIAKELKINGWQSDAADKLATWDPYDQNASAPYFEPEWMFGVTAFDVVIGNPPYIQIQNFPRQQKDLWVDQEFETYVARADIYCLFYERGVRLLKDGGSLAYITSNKYFRSGYGKSLRAFLKKELSLHEILDFADAPVFDALAYASILIGSREAAGPDHTLRAMTWADEERVDQVAAIMDDGAFPLKQAFLSQECWQLEEPEVFAILEKLNKAHTILGDLVEGIIFAGVKTGYNDAFIIDAATKRNLEKADPNSKELIRPYIRGRDIKKWQFSHNDCYIIYTPRGVDIESYPAIKDHLANYKDRLERRALDQKWFELQQAQLRFEQYFTRKKIVYPNVSLGPRFALDEGNHMDMTTFGVDSSDLSLLAILNSSVIDFFFLKLGIERRGGYQEFKTQYVSRIPIPLIQKDDKIALSKLALQAMQSEGNDLNKVEANIDQIVYGLFGLTPKEVQLVKKSVNRAD